MTKQYANGDICFEADYKPNVAQNTIVKRDTSTNTASLKLVALLDEALLFLDTGDLQKTKNRIFWVRNQLQA